MAASCFGGQHERNRPADVDLRQHLARFTLVVLLFLSPSLSLSFSAFSFLKRMKKLFKCRQRERNKHLSATNREKRRRGLLYKALGSPLVHARRSPWSGVFSVALFTFPSPSSSAYHSPLTHTHTYTHKYL